jgi:hypothetical protein
MCRCLSLVDRRDADRLAQGSPAGSHLVSADDAVVCAGEHQLSLGAPGGLGPLGCFGMTACPHCVRDARGGGQVPGHVVVVADGGDLAAADGDRLHCHALRVAGEHPPGVRHQVS